MKTDTFNSIVRYTVFMQDSRNWAYDEHQYTSDNFVSYNVGLDKYLSTPAYAQAIQTGKRYYGVVWAVFKNGQTQKVRDYS